MSARATASPAGSGQARVPPPLAMSARSSCISSSVSTAPLRTSPIDPTGCAPGPLAERHQITYGR